MKFTTQLGSGFSSEYAQVIAFIVTALMAAIALLSAAIAGLLAKTQGSVDATSANADTVSEEPE